MKDQVREFPQFLSSPLQVLCWEMDSFAFIFIGLLLGLVFGGWFWLSLPVLPTVYGSMKKNNPRGFLRHTLYFAGIVEMKDYPSYFEKDFQE